MTFNRAFEANQAEFLLPLHLSGHQAVDTMILTTGSKTQDVQESTLKMMLALLPCTKRQKVEVVIMTT